VAGLTEPTYRRTAANFLCRWAVQELVEIAVPNDMSLGKLLTSNVALETGAQTERAHDPLAVWHPVEEEIKRERVDQTVLSL
jgi:hypothetical protein